MMSLLLLLSSNEQVNNILMVIDGQHPSNRARSLSLSRHRRPLLRVDLQQFCNNFCFVKFANVTMIGGTAAKGTTTAPNTFANSLNRNCIVVH